MRLPLLAAFLATAFAAPVQRELEKGVAAPHRSTADWGALLSNIASSHSSATRAPASAAPSFTHGTRTPAASAPAGSDALSAAVLHKFALASGSGAEPEGAGHDGAASPQNFLLKVAKSPLSMAVVAAAMTEPGGLGFQVISNPQLIADPAVRDPILRHVLMSAHVQSGILGMVAEYSDAIAHTIGMPKDMSEEQQLAFDAAIESAFRRALEPESIDLLIVGHEYTRSADNFIALVDEVAKKDEIMDSAVMDEWKLSEVQVIDRLSGVATGMIIPMVMQIVGFMGGEQASTVDDDVESTLGGTP